jgi:opacity protein-like surface antigen
MFRKSLILAAALAAVVATADRADAQVKPGWYGQVAVGGIWLRDNDGNVDGINVTAEYDTGYGIWAAGGYRFSNGFRTELELGYGRTGFDKLKFLGTSVSIDSDIDLYSGTVNLFYDINTGTLATPYLGGGVGMVYSRAHDGTATVGGTTVRIEGDSSTDLTVFGEVGLALRVSDRIEIVPSYRYQWIDNGSDGFDGDSAHIARIGLRYAF